MKTNNPKISKNNHIKDKLLIPLHNLRHLLLALVLQIVTIVIVRSNLFEPLNIDDRHHADILHLRKHHFLESTSHPTRTPYSTKSGGFSSLNSAEEG